jgi:hypothetical protein
MLNASDLTRKQNAVPSKIELTQADAMLEATDRADQKPDTWDLS